MSSQMFDTQQYPETQLDHDSQEFLLIPDSPVDKPEDNPGAGSVGSFRSAHTEEAAKAAEDTKDSTVTSVASRAPPDWVQQYLGQRKADTWTDLPRKFRGVMNHTCQPAAETPSVANPETMTRENSHVILQQYYNND